MILYYDTMIGCYESNQNSWMEYDNVGVRRSFLACLLGM